MSARYLIDSHIFLWLNDPAPRLSSSALGVLADPAAEIFLSAASVTELCIKNALGKLPLPAEVERNPSAAFGEALDRMRISALDLTLAHATRLRDLPRHHNDPFDRLLIAQALSEAMTIVTRDRAFEQYAGLSLIWG